MADKPSQGLVTRFPPEPNGYLHIGHAKSICVTLGLGTDYQGHCHCRFDDTNPEKESQAFITAIADDIQWLGFSWHGNIRYASDYFDQLHDFAIYLTAQSCLCLSPKPRAGERVSGHFNQARC